MTAGAGADPAIAAAFRAACLDELAALKPGNVHRFADGHRMTVADFEASAAAAAPSIAERGAPVGRRILAAVTATRAAVGTNTNLGIVLLCAPLARAAELVVAEEGAASGADEPAPDGEARGGPSSGRASAADRLRARLAQVLAGLDVADADDAFCAIGLAAPAGLGRAVAHDVAEPATVTLLAAMRAAADRDRIARQYATGYADVFDLGLAALDAAAGRGLGRDAATTAVHLTLLAAFADSHILRKHGAAAAEAVRERAAAVVAAGAAADPEAHRDALLAFDAELKAAGLNPGTTADLTVATLLVDRLRG